MAEDSFTDVASRTRTAPHEPCRYATNGVADELALAMLAHLLDDLPIHVEIAGTRLQASNLLALVQTRS